MTMPGTPLPDPLPAITDSENPAAAELVSAVSDDIES
jgi:hypothetical protein